MSALDVLKRTYFTVKCLCCGSAAIIHDPKDAHCPKPHTTYFRPNVTPDADPAATVDDPETEKLKHEIAELTDLLTITESAMHGQRGVDEGHVVYEDANTQYQLACDRLKSHWQQHQRPTLVREVIK